MNSNKIGDKEIKDIIGKSQSILDMISGPLKKVAEEIRLLLEMLRDFVSGDFDAPVNTVISITITLIYLVNPFDIVPDFIPFAGLMDDALVISAAVAVLKSDIDKYKKWRKTKEENSSQKETNNQ